MVERLHIRAAWAPMLLVLAYGLVVLAAGVRAEDLIPLFLAHLRRSVIALLALTLIALLLTLIVKAVRGDTEERPFVFLARLVQDAWRRDRLLSFGFAPVFFALVLASFSSFKQSLLPLAGFRLDPAFAQLDRALFAGTDPWKLTHWLVPSAEGTWWIDRAYVAWFAPLIIFVLMSWAAPVKLRTQFLLSFAVTWILLGSVMAFLLPGAGPCYYGAFHAGADMFAPLNLRLAEQNAFAASSGWGDLVALKGQMELLDSFRTKELMVAGGISAMPSLHNAFAVLFACVGFRHGRTAGALLIWRAAGIATERLLSPAARRPMTAPVQPLPQPTAPSRPLRPSLP